MKFHTGCIISIFLSLVSGCHIPDLQLNSDIDITDDHSNKGLVNSAIVNNWSQSLNIGCVSLCGCLLLILGGTRFVLEIECPNDPNRDSVNENNQRIIKEEK